MPFKSEKQRRYMYANKPEMAERWSDKDKKSRKKKARKEALYRLAK